MATGQPAIDNALAKQQVGKSVKLPNTVNRDKTPPKNGIASAGPAPKKSRPMPSGSVNSTTPSPRDGSTAVQIPLAKQGLAVSSSTVVNKKAPTPVYSKASCASCGREGAVGHCFTCGKSIHTVSRKCSTEMSSSSSDSSPTRYNCTQCVPLQRHSVASTALAPQQQGVSTRSHTQQLATAEAEAAGKADKVRPAAAGHAKLFKPPRRGKAKRNGGGDCSERGRRGGPSGHSPVPDPLPDPHALPGPHTRCPAAEVVDGLEAMKHVGATPAIILSTIVENLADDSDLYL